MLMRPIVSYNFMGTVSQLIFTEELKVYRICFGNSNGMIKCADGRSSLIQCTIMQHTSEWEWQLGADSEC